MDDTEVVHCPGMDVTFGGRRRQRCGWCGALILDQDFTRMAWPLNEDGTDPGPPAPLKMGALYAMTGGMGEPFRALRLLDDANEPDAPAGAKAVPPNSCLMLDPEVTA